MQKVLCLVGPTAIGKTALSIRLAQQLKADIVSGDSMQVYRELKVGTARPTSREMQGVKHFLVGTRSIFDSFGVKDFVQAAQTAISQIRQAGHLPLLVGGTGFYLKALLYDLQLGERGRAASSIDPAWEKYLQSNGAQLLWQQLNARDPAAAEKIPWQNSRRCLRALTVIQRTGRLFSHQQTKISPRYDFLIIGLSTDRSRLYQRINHRVDLMMEHGLLEEAKLVYDHRSEVEQAGQAIGYKEFFPYFAGQADLQSCIARLKQASRHYAKRQLTYFRHQLPVAWLDPFSQAFESQLQAMIGAWLKKH